MDGSGWCECDSSRASRNYIRTFVSCGELEWRLCTGFSFLWGPICVGFLQVMIVCGLVTPSEKWSFERLGVFRASLCTGWGEATCLLPSEIEPNWSILPGQGLCFLSQWRGSSVHFCSQIYFHRAFHQSLDFPVWHCLICDRWVPRMTWLFFPYQSNIYV